MTIDLDRLHADYMEKWNGSGRTFDMLMTALQHADFDVSLVVIVGANRDQAFGHLMDEFRFLAVEMEYEWVRKESVSTLRVLNTEFRFESYVLLTNIRSIPQDTPIFWDHYADDVKHGMRDLISDPNWGPSPLLPLLKGKPPEIPWTSAPKEEAPPADS